MGLYMAIAFLMASTVMMAARHDMQNVERAWHVIVTDLHARDSTRYSDWFDMHIGVGKARQWGVDHHCCRCRIPTRRDPGLSLAISSLTFKLFDQRPRVSLSLD